MQHYAISASRDGFRRAGREWSREATVVAEGDLAPEQLEALRDDKNITVTPCAPEGPEIEGSSDVFAEAAVVREALRGTSTTILRGWLIRAAMGELEPGNEDHWTSSGAPEIAAVKRLTGLASISAAERDELWEMHQG